MMCIKSILVKMILGILLSDYMKHFEFVCLFNHLYGDVLKEMF